MSDRGARDGRRKRRKKQRREARGRLFAALLRGCRRITARVPPKAAIRLGALLGGWAHDLLAKPRRLAREHLEIAFGSDDPARNARIAREAFRNAGRTVGEIVVLSGLSGRLEDYVTIEGLDHFDAALSGGRGVIAVAAHLGNWELLAASVAARGYRVAVVGRRPHEKALFELLEEVRSGYGVETIWRENPGAPRQILRTLRSNGIVALLIDQESFRLPSVVVPFFGRPARTPSGAATLALRFRAPCVPVFIRRNEAGGHTVEFEPAISPEDFTGENAETELTAALTARIEARIRARPEEWVWWHRRWRQREVPA